MCQAAKRSWAPTSLTGRIVTKSEVQELSKQGGGKGLLGEEAMSQSSEKVNRGDSAVGYHGQPSFLGFPGAKTDLVSPLRNTLFILESPWSLTSF